LYAGCRTSVYRGIRENDYLPVVIKFLTSEYPSFNKLLHFRNQYAIAKNAEERYQSALGLKQDFRTYALYKQIILCINDNRSFQAFINHHLLAAIAKR
jgi:hypothetical protein